MDPSACRVIYIDDRFNTERWISRDGLTPISPQRTSPQGEFSELPPDLQANVNAFLSVFNQVFVCASGRSFSTKLSELHDQVKSDCTPIIACFDVGSEGRHQNLRHESYFRKRPQFNPAAANDPDSPLPSPTLLRREITFSAENDESYGIPLLSRIASDLQVDDHVQLIIPVGVVQPRRRDSYDQAMHQGMPQGLARAPFGPETEPARIEDTSDVIDPQLMLQCLDAGALDVVKSPLDKAGIMGLTVHAYRIYKNAKKEQAAFMAVSGRGRKASWVGVEEEGKPYAYLREAMVKKLLKGICEPQLAIEDYQHRDLHVDTQRKAIIAEAVGKWSFDGHDFSEDELVYAGYFILNHAVSPSECETWRQSEDELVRFMQGCRVAYNNFVLYHNFRHAVDVLQSLFYFLVQIGTLPPYPVGSPPPPKSQDKSPIAKLMGPFDALALLISAIGHDVGHPGVNNMFLVKLNAPLAQLYNDQSVLEAFHCAAYSQILRRHWPSAFNDKTLRRLMISSILATDMGVHSDYMQQLGILQEKIHESKVTDSWTPKDREAFRVLTCGLLIKCADISNVARPWSVAEKWTHLLQKEFAKQGEMEQAVGMETTLFGGPPELGNMLKLANGQIGFMTIFAHPLFANVTDIIPAMGFAAEEILTNKGVWFTRAEHEKMKQILKKGTGYGDGGAVSPRSQSPIGPGRKPHSDSYFPTSPLRQNAESPKGSIHKFSDAGIGLAKSGNGTSPNHSPSSSLAAVAGIAVPPNGHEPRRSSKDRSSRSRRRSRDGPVSNADGHRDSKATLTPGRSPNGIYGSSENDAPNRANDSSASELSDTRRDEGMSMRAGSTAIPAAGPEAAHAPNSTPAALQSFKFATSDDDEPVRTYDPEQHYPPLHASARASMPAQNLEEQEQQLALAQEAQQNKLAKSAPPEAAPQFSNLRGGDDDDTLTPTHSTEATSYTTEQSEEPSRQQARSDFEAQRNRATSAPMQAASTNVQPADSVSSAQSATSRDSGKNDMPRSVMSNGDVEGSHRDRKSSTKTLGRRRSRIKMNLAFWKKNKDKEEDCPVESQGQGGPVGG